MGRRAVLQRLDEEADEEAALTPRERGTLLHSLFEEFYRSWDAAGHGAITMATLPEAIAAFWRAVTKIADQLGVGAGFRVVSNHGPNGGQLVFHFHVHITGRR